MVTFFPISTESMMPSAACFFCVFCVAFLSFCNQCLEVGIWLLAQFYQIFHAYLLLNLIYFSEDHYRLIVQSSDLGGPYWLYEIPPTMESTILQVKHSSSTILPTRPPSWNRVSPFSFTSVCRLFKASNMESKLCFIADTALWASHLVSGRSLGT